MPHEMSPGKPSTRRYSQAEKDRAVRAVRQLRKELGAEYGTRKRVADQLGIGVESLRSWVKQAEIDDVCLVGQQRSQCCANDVQRNRESQRQPEPAPEHLQVVASVLVAARVLVLAVVYRLPGRIAVGLHGQIVLNVRVGRRNLSLARELAPRWKSMDESCSSLGRWFVDGILNRRTRRG